MFLAQPKSPLLHVVASRTTVSGWGDIASGAIFIAASGRDLAELAAAVIAVAASAIVFLAIGVIFHSLAFWLGRLETLARQVWEFLITFTIYPRTLFGGGM